MVNILNSEVVTDFVCTAWEHSVLQALQCLVRFPTQNVLMQWEEWEKLSDKLHQFFLFFQIQICSNNNNGQQRFCPMRKNVCFWCICRRWIQICFQNFCITHNFHSRLKAWNLLHQDTSVFLPWAPWRIQGFLLPGRWRCVLQWCLFCYGSSWPWI